MEEATKRVEGCMREVGGEGGKRVIEGGRMREGEYDQGREEAER